MTKISDIENPVYRLLRKFEGCDKFYYSIIYSQFYKKYYVISDIKCNSHENFFPLIEEEEEEEEEEKNNELNTEEEKEDEKELKRKKRRKMKLN